jgi:hypothetical protein
VRGEFSMGILSGGHESHYDWKNVHMLLHLALPTSADALLKLGINVNPRVSW